MVVEADATMQAIMEKLQVYRNRLTILFEVSSPQVHLMFFLLLSTAWSCLEKRCWISALSMQGFQYELGDFHIKAGRAVLAHTENLRGIVLEVCYIFLFSCFILFHKVVVSVSWWQSLYSILLLSLSQGKRLSNGSVLSKVLVSDEIFVTSNKHVGTHYSKKGFLMSSRIMICDYRNRGILRYAPIPIITYHDSINRSLNISTSEEYTEDCIRNVRRIAFGTVLRTIANYVNKKWKLYVSIWVRDTCD